MSLAYLYQRLVFLTGFIFSSTLALGQDYYVPIKKELEPQARLPVESFELSDAVLNYRLPLDITGRPIDVRLIRDASNPGPGRSYRGPLGQATCMGTDQLPACVVQHQNLAIKATDLEGFARKKYQNPQLLAQITQVQTAFSTPNEPIGFIARRTIVKTPDNLDNWDSSTNLTDGSKRLGVRIELKGEQGSFRFNPSPNAAEKLGELSQVFRHGTAISGRWTLDQRKGWFQWQLNSTKTAFEGTWGLIARDGSRSIEGTWSGTLRN